VWTRQEQAAEKLNASSNSDFVLNDRVDLSVFTNGSFDFIYSSIVLQHIPRPYAMGYISEFCRLLAPGGLVVFQVPIGRHRLIRLKDALIAKVALRTRLRRLLKQRISPLLTARIEMHVIPKTAVEQELIVNGVKLAGLAYTNSCDPSFNGNLEISNQPRYYAHYLSGLFAGQRA
jgi:ubiquinone/menaquinone biosynthesis C-methylase UbiE